MKLSANALTTLETLKSHVGIPLGDSSKDTVLMLFINGGSSAVEKYTGRRFKQGTYVEKYDGDGESQELYLDGAPIDTVTSVKIASVVIAPADYTVYTNYILLNDAEWPAGRKNIEVSYIGGFVLPKDETDVLARTLPFDVELATLKVVAGMFNRKDAEGINRSNSGGMSADFGTVFNDEVKGLLKPYRYLHV